MPPPFRGILPHGEPPLPMPAEVMANAITDKRIPRSPGGVRESLGIEGREVVRNFLANVAQNRTIPAATHVAQRALDDIIAQEIDVLRREAPEIMDLISSAPRPGMRETLGMAPPGDPDVLSSIVQTLRTGPELPPQQKALMINQHTLRALSGMQEAEAIMGGAIDPSDFEHPLLRLRALLSAAAMNNTVRMIPGGKSAGAIRGTPDRNLNYDILNQLNLPSMRGLPAQTADPLVATVDFLESAGVPAESINERFLRLMQDFEKPQMMEMESLGPLMDPRRVRADINQAAEGRPEGPPDADFLMRMMGVPRY